MTTSMRNSRARSAKELSCSVTPSSSSPRPERCARGQGDRSGPRKRARSRRRRFTRDATTRRPHRRRPDGALGPNEDTDEDGGGWARGVRGYRAGDDDQGSSREAPVLVLVMVRAAMATCDPSSLTARIPPVRKSPGYKRKTVRQFRDRSLGLFKQNKTTRTSTRDNSSKGSTRVSFQLLYYHLHEALFAIVFSPRCKNVM